MRWQYGLLKHADGSFKVHEVYFCDKHDMVLGWTEDVISLDFPYVAEQQQDWKSIVEQLRMMASDIETSRSHMLADDMPICTACLNDWLVIHK